MMLFFIQALAGDPLRSGVGVLEGVLEGVRFGSEPGDRLTDLEDDLDLERDFLLLLSLLGLRFDLSLPAGDGERDPDLERLSERTGDLL